MNARSRSNRRPTGDRSPSARPASGAASRSREPDDGTAAAWLLRLVDFGLAAILFIAPLFMGGRHEIGRLVYVSVIGFTATAWSIRQWFLASPRYRWSGAEPILLAAVMLVILQLVPLPQSVLLWISPEIGELLPMWTGQASAGGSLGTWNQLSLAPMATQAGLVTLLAHVLLFLVVVQRLQDTRDIERMLKWVASASILMASVGLAQFLFGNGKFLWIYEHPSRDTFGVAKGTFQNQNHFANFLAMGLGPLIWWLFASFRGVRRRRDFRSNDSSSLQARNRFPVLAIGLGLVALAGLLTFSRGGVIALSSAALVCLAVFWLRGTARRQILITIVTVSAFMAAALSIHGYVPLLKRLNTLTQSRSLEELSEGRAALWRAHSQIIPRFPISGTGAGSHAEVYRTYFDQHFYAEFTHGESGYLHLLVENGVPGLLLALAALSLCLYWAIHTGIAGRDVDRGLMAGAVAASLAASLLQSAGDFVWYLPACLSLVVILAAAGCRLYQITTAGKPPVGRFLGWLRSLTAERNLRVPGSLGLASPLFVFGLAALSMTSLLPAARAALSWDQYLKLSRAARHQEEPSTEATQAMVHELKGVLREDPYDSRANLRLAAKNLQLFDEAQQASENPMGLAQIRDAALASGFPSQADLDRWLDVVMGPRREWLDQALEHTQRAVRLSPLQGDAYIYLGELAFLDRRQVLPQQSLLEQALRARPYNGYVLLAAGSEAAQQGDAERALELWKRGFSLDPDVQKEIVQRLASQVSAEEFLREFPTDQSGLLYLFRHYQKAGSVDQAQIVAPPLLAAIQEELDAEPPPERQAMLWDQARVAEECLGNVVGAAEAASRAVALSPDNFGRHYQLAHALMARCDYDAACREFQWCLRRRPEDAGLQRQLTAAAKLRVAEGSQTQLR